MREPPASKAENAFRSAGALARDGRAAEAVDAYAAILTADPQSVRAHVGLAAALIALGRHAEGEAQARAALGLAPLDPAAVRTCAAALQLQARHADALAFAHEVIARDPRHVEALMAAGDSLANLGRHEEALQRYEAVRSAGAATVETLVRIGMMRGALDRPDAAEAFDAALALDPDAPEPRFQRGKVRLAHGDFARGWGDYEARWRSERFVTTSRGVTPKPMVPALAVRQAAADLQGKRVVVVGEQGVGDQLMFASAIPDLARLAERVTLVCEPRLTGLFAASFEGIEVVDPRGAKVDTDTIDAILAIGSLGYAFRGAEAAFPGTPYLAPRPQARRRWAERLGPRPAGGLRIGLSWRGGTPTTRRAARSLSLDDLAPILELPGCQVVSLQYGDVAAELAGRQIRAFPAAETDDFEDLAALTAEMDVVVSVQTALVHLCGAIGQRCLTMVPHNAEWRYGAAGPTMPWYGSVRLFRQAEPGAWAPVIAEVAAELSARLAAASRPVEP